MRLEGATKAYKENAHTWCEGRNWLYYLRKADVQAGAHCHSSLQRFSCSSVARPFLFQTKHENRQAPSHQDRWCSESRRRRLGEGASTTRQGKERQDVGWGVAVREREEGRMACSHSSLIRAVGKGSASAQEPRGVRAVGWPDEMSQPHSPASAPRLSGFALLQSGELSLAVQEPGLVRAAKKKGPAKALQLGPSSIRPRRCDASLPPRTS